jgi:hypothetical protein
MLARAGLVGGDGEPAHIQARSAMMARAWSSRMPGIFLGGSQELWSQ